MYEQQSAGKQARGVSMGRLAALRCHGRQQDAFLQHHVSMDNQLYHKQ